MIRRSEVPAAAGLYKPGAKVYCDKRGVCWACNTPDTNNKSHQKEYLSIGNVVYGFDGIERNATKGKGKIILLYSNPVFSAAFALVLRLHGLFFKLITKNDNCTL